MKRILTSFAAAMVAYGLWAHDWRVILAGVSVATIWPLISADVEAASREELLEALWDDDEIERSEANA